MNYMCICNYQGVIFLHYLIAPHVMTFHYMEYRTIPPNFERTINRGRRDSVLEFALEH